MRLIDWRIQLLAGWSPALQSKYTYCNQAMRRGSLPHSFWQHVCSPRVEFHQTWNCFWMIADSQIPFQPHEWRTLWSRNASTSMSDQNWWRHVPRELPELNLLQRWLHWLHFCLLSPISHASSSAIWRDFKVFGYTPAFIIKKTINYNDFDVVKMSSLQFQSASPSESIY